ncbi:MAG TPA: glycosyltransferase family 2 protein [Parachlamydiaceae bacterium]|nr:glycosyltransferase family 2 protein [Parachlamydiaceae bacterium]
MMHRFKVVVPSFNSIDYIAKTLQSIEMQTDPEYDVCVIDDGSTISGQREIITDFCERNGWKFLFNDRNHGALYGMVHAIRLLECQDDDVIVVIDGDDWLAHAEVFTKLRKVYTENDVYLTWGQCQVYPGGKTPVNYAQNIPELVVQQKLYRDIPFVFWHLGTFKYFLWRHIDDSDLRDVDGEYLLLMKDKATLYPMLEMAEGKIQFINETLYMYNIENPLNDYANTRPEEHVRVDELIRGRKRYSRLRFPNE